MKSTALANSMLDAALRATAYQGPATLYLALFAPGGVEIATGAYTRQAITFAAASGKSSVSNADVLFPIATVGYTVHSAALMTASSGGDVMYSGDLENEEEMGEGDRLAFPAGSVVVSED